MCELLRGGHFAGGYLCLQVSHEEYLKIVDNYNKHIEQGLLKRIAGGDEPAFKELFFYYRQFVYKIAWTYTENSSVSEEILQDVFIIIWNNRNKLVTIRDFHAYLYVITKNRGLRVLKEINTLRRQDQASLFYQALWEKDHLHNLSEHQIQQLLHDALAGLSPQQRKVFELSRLEGLPREKIAEQLGISKATVSAHLTIALRLVRARLVTHFNLVLITLPFWKNS